jgi:hypothetical protein
MGSGWIQKSAIKAKPKTVQFRSGADFGELADLSAMSNQPKSKSAAAYQEWLRITEAVAFSRISKPKLYDLINRGLIKTVSLRERGQIKGTRLVSFDSLRSFLESRSTGGTTPTA